MGPEPACIRPINRSVLCLPCWRPASKAREAGLVEWHACCARRSLPLGQLSSLKASNPLAAKRFSFAVKIGIAGEVSFLASKYNIPRKAITSARCRRGVACSLRAQPEKQASAQFTYAQIAREQSCVKFLPRFVEIDCGRFARGLFIRHMCANSIRSNSIRHQSELAFAGPCWKQFDPWRHLRSIRCGHSQRHHHGDDTRRPHRDDCAIKRRWKLSR